MRYWRRPLGAFLTTMAVTAAGTVGIYAVRGDLGGGGGGTVPGTYNLAVVPSGGSASCVRDSTAVAYASLPANAKCNSTTAALNATSGASSPTTVLIASGSYASQSITATKTSGTKVTFVGETDGSGNRLATLAGLSACSGGACPGAWIEVQDVKVTSVFSADAPSGGSGTPHDLTFRNIDWDDGGTSGGGLTTMMWMDSCCQNVSFIGGKIHGIYQSTSGASIAVTGRTTKTIGPLTFDGVEIYNNGCNGVAGNHYEIVRVNSQNAGLTLRNNYFHDNGSNSATIFFSTNGTGLSPQAVIEGNYFDSPLNAGACGSTNGLAINTNMEGGSCASLTVRYNTFKGSVMDWAEAGAAGECTAGTASNVKAWGNVAPKGTSSCYGSDPNVNNNLWINATSSNCGASDQTVASTTAAGLTGDGFHISGTSPARGLGPSSGTTACPATDRDGDTRPLGGGNCDAGADEVN